MVDERGQRPEKIGQMVSVARKAMISQITTFYSCAKQKKRLRTYNLDFKHGMVVSAR